jgi:hypothetical protein
VPILPVSGIDARLLPPGGAEDLLLAEAGRHGPLLALALLERLAVTVSGPPLDWGELSVTDVEALLLVLRQALFGDSLRSDVPCPAPDCGGRMEVSFRLSEYLAHHCSRAPRGVRPAEEPGWYQHDHAGLEFRLPTATDQVAARASDRPVDELARRCIRPYPIAARERLRAEQAMATLAPSLSHDLSARCPECDARVAFYFDVPRFVLGELAGLAAGIFEDVHLLASAYGWPEQQVLALPASRRRRYAELVRASGMAE